MKSWMKTLISSTILSMGMLLTSAVAQDNIVRDYGDDDQQNDRSNEQYDNNQPLIDRYLDVQVWTNHRDGEYYEGDNINISFMANRDAFVVIYSIDTRGRVELLYPADPGDDNFVSGGVTYRLPSVNSNYDLKVTGPSGTENIQVIASRERIPIPDWYPNSGITTDEEDRSDFMEYINARYFVRYDGQRFAYDRASLYVNEWEPVYYQPVYYPDYPSWSVCGNVYIDYPYGATVYINGVYWGCAPLYVPRILCGWQTVTIYDPWGYCWEDDIHVSRYRTVVLNKTIIRTSVNNVSKYKEVRTAGYRDPVKNGYPKFAEKQKIAMGSANVGKTGIDKKQIVPSQKGNSKNFDGDNMTLPKKYLYGDGSVTKTDRGYETKGGSAAGSGYERKQRSSANSKSDGTTSTYRKDKPSSNGSGYSAPRKTQDGNSSVDNGSTYRKESGATKAPSKKTPTVKRARPKVADDGDKPAQAKPAAPQGKPGAVQKDAPQRKAEGKVSQPAPKNDGGGAAKRNPGSGKKKGD